MTSILGGVLVALATPFAADESIDTSRLRALVDRTIDGGVHGVVACGSTGEFSALDRRRAAIRRRDRGRPGRPSGAGGRPDRLDQHRRGDRAVPARRVRRRRRVMPVAPYYEALSLTETTHYLRRVASSVAIPVMLYNLPAATGVDLLG